MFDLDKWQEILLTLRRNRLRTFLTAFGVFWGILMLIVMLGMGNGLQYGVNNNMFGFGSNAIFVWGGRATMPFEGLKPGRRVAYTTDDIAALEAIDGLEVVSPRVRLGHWRDGQNISRGTKAGNFGVNGHYPNIDRVRPVGIIAGRHLNQLDLDERRKVAVIGDQVKTELFGRGENAIGGSINIQGVYFQVIGVFKSLRGDEWAKREEESLMVPFTTFQQTYNLRGEVHAFILGAAEDVSADDVEKEVRRVLAARHHVNPDDAQAIQSRNAAAEFNKVQKLFFGIEVLVWIVGIATLLAGVMGVSNIMLIVVKERTHEIGIRKAVGATPFSIVSLIMQESVTLTAVAGYTGLVVGVGIIEVVNAKYGAGTGAFANPTIDIGIAAIATVILIIAGGLAGLIPARHAARIKPVVALRAEK